MARDYTALADFFPDRTVMRTARRKRPDPAALAAAEERAARASERFMAEELEIRNRVPWDWRARPSKEATEELREANAALRAIRG